IAVTDRNGEVELTRVAVGDHILLGGDNMDLTLAHALAQKFAADGKRLDSWQLAGLTYGCRIAKEQLFNDPSLAAAPIVAPSRGSALLGNALRTELTRGQLEALLTEGFFPPTAVNDAPTTGRRSGLAQMGLPYAADPAITRHLAAFLSRQARAL